MRRGRKPAHPQYYIDPDDLKRSVMESRAQGMMTEELGRYVLTIHARVANTFPRFKGYSTEVKEEIQSAAIYKFVKYHVWQRLDPDKGSVFAYITTCAFRNMLTALGRYYRDFNRKMEIVKNTIDELRQYFQNLKYQPRGWEEAVESFQDWAENHPTLQDDEDVVEQARGDNE